ncbi:MAG: tRNA lysidine(34) synthetase TilS [Bullifex sp.]
MKDLVSAVRSFFETEGIGTDGVFHLAFSGGSDSLPLLHALTKVITGFLDAVYVDHALRDRSILDEEIALNRKNCELIGVPLTVYRLSDGEVEALASERGITLEAAARELRYRYFDTLDGYVITGHNMDDQAESVFMKLLTGSTFQSLAGIRKVRGKYLRPMLSVPKSEILRYADENGLVCSHDHTNSELFCLRNRVRHLVMPYLSDEVKLSLVNIADNVSAFVSETGVCEIYDMGLYVYVSSDSFFSASDLKRDITLLTVLSGYAERRISRGELGEIISHAGRKKSFYGREYIVTFFGDEIRFYPQKYWFSARFNDHLSSGPYRVTVSDAENALFLPLDGSLIIRMDESGDMLRTKGGNIKVSELLSSMGVPYAPVVTDRGKAVAVFASCLGGVNRISSDLINPQWRDETRVDVISASLT